jgi:Uma2 family endonuclease
LQERQRDGIEFVRSVGRKRELAPERSWFTGTASASATIRLRVNDTCLSENHDAASNPSRCCVSLCVGVFMDGSVARKSYSRADFLAWEARQKDRYEFLDGVITMMAGGTADHNTIATNVTATLHRLLRGKGCRTFQHNQKIAPAERDEVLYPDVMVVCGKVAGESTIVEQATLVVEIVSASSRRRDYEKKWTVYRTIRELRHYVVIEQERALVTCFSRASDEDPWLEETVEGLKGKLKLTALDVTLAMKQIYEDTAVAGS